MKRRLEVIVSYSADEILEVGIEQLVGRAIDNTGVLVAESVVAGDVIDEAPKEVIQ